MRTNTALPVLPLAVLSLAFATVGCATAPKGPGFIDPRMAAAAQWETVKEVEISIDGSGNITKIAVEQSSGDKVPEALRKLVEATYAGGTITEYEQELYQDNVMVHEVEVKTADGKECEISATEAGALRYTECKLKPEELAEPIKKGVETAAPGAEITEAEVRKTADGAEDFRLEVKANNRKWYFRFKADGTMTERSRLVEAEVAIPVQ